MDIGKALLRKHWALFLWWQLLQLRTMQFGAFNNLKTFQLGEVPGKIIGLIIAFIVYRVFHAIADAFRHVSEVPFIGTIDSILGSIVGFVEACILIYVFTYITGIDVKEVALTVLDKLITNI